MSGVKLALMPQSSSTSDFHSSLPYTSTSTMSVAVLSPAQPSIYGQIPMFSAQSAHKAPSKRPKLSLNTTTTVDSPYRSKQSTSLRLETLSATSPTARNTWGNAFARPVRSSKPATPQPARRDSAGPDIPVEQAIVIANPSPISATCEVESTAEIIPYTLGYDVNSILRNGPVDRKRNCSSPVSQSKPIFSLTKRVIFRAPLTEEVKNKQYTLRHSDITTTVNTPTTTLPVARDASRSNLHKLVLRTSSSKVDEEEHDNEQENNEVNEDDTMLDCPATPVAGRNKNDRHWYWTLGPERLHGSGAATVPGTVTSPLDLEDAS